MKVMWSKLCTKIQASVSPLAKSTSPLVTRAVWLVSVLSNSIEFLVIMKSAWSWYIVTT